MNIRPKWHIDKTPIFHMTAIENLDSICKQQSLFAFNKLINHSEFKSIANQDVQNRRREKQVQLSPFGTLHDYVPFYFAPRSPMLYANTKGSNLESLTEQEKIIYLTTDIQTILKNKLLYIFFEKPLVGLFARYWHNDYNNEKSPFWRQRKEIRQAEFLIFKKIELKYIQEIVTFDETSCDIVKSKLMNENINVRVDKTFYF